MDIWKYVWESRIYPQCMVDIIVQRLYRQSHLDLQAPQLVLSDTNKMNKKKWICICLNNTICAATSYAHAAHMQHKEHAWSGPKSSYFHQYKGWIGVRRHCYKIIACLLVSVLIIPFPFSDIGERSMWVRFHNATGRRNWLTSTNGKCIWGQKATTPDRCKMGACRINVREIHCFYSHNDHHWKRSITLTLHPRSHHRCHVESASIRILHPVYTRMHQQKKT